MAPLSESPPGPTAFRFILKTACISQADLARELGCTRQWVHDILKGRVRPTPRFIHDTPIVLGERMTVDPAELRSIFFPEQADEPKTSVLGRHLAKTEAA